MRGMKMSEEDEKQFQFWYKHWAKKTVRAMRRHQTMSKKTSILDNIMDFLKGAD